LENSKIEWCNHTANLWWGCTNVHSGCDHCYAEAFAHRYNHTVWGKDAPRKEVKSVWKELERFQRDAKKSGTIRRVFVGSMMDIFEKPMPLVTWKSEKLSEENDLYWNTGMLRDRFFIDVIPNSPNLLFLLLTKRPSNINKYIPEHWKLNPPDNVIFGTSPVNQETADKLILQLSEVNGQKFLSVEPQLAEIDWTTKLKDDSGRTLLDVPDWIINGGESGHGKRPFNTDWARQLRDECKIKNVPFFFKQIDKVKEIPDDLMVREFPLFKNQITI
jgi:protein gp37